MIIFNKTNKGITDVNEIIFRAAKDKSNVTDQTIRNIRTFVSCEYTQMSELNNFIDQINEVTSIVRMILLENEFYKLKCLTQVAKLGLVSQQEQDINNHLNLFEMKTNLKFHIGHFISKICKESSDVVKPNMEVYEVGGFILLNNILYTIFNNARCDIYNTIQVAISRDEYLRLFNKFLFSMFRTGAYIANKKAMENVETYKKNLLELITVFLCEIPIDIPSEFVSFINRRFTADIFEKLSNREIAA